MRSSGIGCWQRPALRRHQPAGAHSTTTGGTATSRSVTWPGDWLLRCVFGDPFAPYVFFSPAWISPEVVDLARTIYEDRAFERMPLLGEALKDAGCRNWDLIEHCRSLHPHVRGCWVVDLALGKS